MAKFIIEGKQKLSGSITVSGAKNAALKIIPASILSRGVSVIKNVPDIGDIRRLIEIIESIGADISFKDNTVTVDATPISSCLPDENLVKKLRGSIVIAGPLLGRFGKAVLSQPGGCLIGARPIDDHVDMFEQFGVKVTRTKDKYILQGKPRAGKIVLNHMSVTATENAIMAAVLAKGVTEIQVAAPEPEIVDLANYLNKMGAKIEGAGTSLIHVTGVDALNGVEYEVLPDRIEAETLLIMAIATNSVLKIGPVVTDHMSLVLKRLIQAGARFHITKSHGAEYIETEKSSKLKAVDIDTRNYPCFPTDLQSQYAVLMTQAEGTSQVFETLFEGRFQYTDELIVMGAKITILSPYMINVEGPTPLKGKKIISRDIRGGAALVIAALVAEGKTIIDGVELIERGYENLDQKLRNVGANIERIEA